MMLCSSSNKSSKASKESILEAASVSLVSAQDFREVIAESNRA